MTEETPMPWKLSYKEKNPFTGQTSISSAKAPIRPG